MTEISASLTHLLAVAIDLASFGLILALFPMGSYLRQIMARIEQRRELELLEHERRKREICAREIASLLGDTEATQ